MSTVISIEELRREFLEKTKPADIKEFVHKQQQLLEKYMRQCNELQEKLDSADKIINSMGGSLIIGNSREADEEYICLEQIRILKDKSRDRELDINDVKKLDLLIKNLRLIRSQPTENVNEMRDVSEQDLLSIAKGD